MPRIVGCTCTPLFEPMATSSERSPPPFPEDLEPEPDEVGDQDSDDGEDIFLGTDNPLEIKMDPSLSASDIANSTKPLSEASSPPVMDLLSEPASQASSAPMVDLLLEPASEGSSAPMVNILSEPASEASSAPMVDLLMEPASEASSAPMVDLLMEPASEGSSAPMVDLLMEPASEASSAPMMNLLMEPASEASSAPMMNLLMEPASDDLKEPPKPDIDPLADITNDTPLSEVKTPVAAMPQEPPSDLFDDEPSELFAEPRQSNTAKQQQTSIFDEPDEDLFSEPLGEASKKPQNDFFKEALAPVAKASNVCGPLSDNYNEHPTDIFSEEAITTLPSAVSTVSVNSKTNGVHSDEEEPDIFAATVELSLDSPRNDRKKKEAAKPSASAPAPSVSASASKPQPKTLEELEEEVEDKFELNISITNPEKVGDGMNAYMAYKVSTQTTLPMFRSKTFTVRRRFSDFLGLYEKLSDKHTLNGYIVPPPPEKSIMGMTKVKVGKEDNSSAEFVERRRAALERYLQRVVFHPSLLQDPDVREFLERDDMPRAHNTQALSGAGFLKMINRATDSLSKMTIKMNESDVWFEEKLQEVEAEDQQLRKLHIMVDSLVGHRKELSVNTGGFAKSVAMLGSSEDNTALSRALSQLAEVEDKMEQLHQEQAASDSFCFAELLADYIRLLGSVRASFDQRMKTWQRWQDAQNMLQKKRETEAKLLWANKPDKLQQAKDDITEWEAKVTQYERDFDRVSATVRKEVLRFEKEKARDFKKQIIKYLESLLQSQQQLIKYWEAFLPEAKAIA
ncbi:sorting nexin-1a isoform X2 [Oncorhynchus keta]|uniref:sorting nexin-1a isoform X2 n=1 Tax=Oncorhynchus keta TaxID=8018 RepID=UPI00227AC32B|nr:sorting nexin-1a isoform X2 [Oncorhynchus keta]